MEESELLQELMVKVEVEADRISAQKAELRRQQIDRQKKLDKERAALILMALSVEIDSRFSE